MTIHDSESDIARRLGASLTPRVPRITVQHRGEQSSGLFDIGALYAANLQQVMQRAQAMREPPIRHVGVVVAQQPAPWARVPASVPAAAAYTALWAEEETELEIQPTARPKGVGWFGVAVAWLATTGMGALIATTVPAHALARDHAPARGAAATTATPAVAPVVAVAPTPATPPSAIATPPAVPSRIVAPVAVPRPAEPQMSLAVTALEPTPGAAPKKASAPARLRTSPVTRAASADLTPSASPATATQAAAPVAEAPAPPRVEPKVEMPAPKAAAANAPPPAAGASLEDLMRRAVEADSKHH